MTEQNEAALLARWDAAHVLHREDPCDCADGFGGCNHVSCYECDQEWPCESVREALGVGTAEQYLALEQERFALIEASAAPSETRCRRCLEWNLGDPWYCPRCGKETTLTPHDGGAMGDAAIWSKTHVGILGEVYREAAAEQARASTIPATQSENGPADA